MLARGRDHVEEIRQQICWNPLERMNRGTGRTQNETRKSSKSNTRPVESNAAPGTASDAPANMGSAAAGTAGGAFDGVVVRGAREHNLKNVDVSIPRDSLTVITGLSGSGKSSLAFDTIYAEGQRRYVESLSPYARQFLGLMERPDVDLIEGLSPAISIEQKTVSTNPRSTVGTVTEIYDYLRLLFARAGTPHCPNCGRPVQRQSSTQIAEIVLAWPPGTKIEVRAPLVQGRKGEFRDLF